MCGYCPGDSDEIYSQLKPSDKEDMLTGRCGLLPREEREKFAVEFEILIVGVSALARSIRAKALGLAGKR